MSISTAPVVVLAWVAKYAMESHVEEELTIDVHGCEHDAVERCNSWKDKRNRQGGSTHLFAFAS